MACCTPVGNKLVCVVRIHISEMIDCTNTWNVLKLGICQNTVSSSVCGGTHCSVLMVYLLNNFLFLSLN